MELLILVAAVAFSLLLAVAGTRAILWTLFVMMRSRTVVTESSALATTD
jgi:hypothetical protein